MVIISVKNVNSLQIDILVRKRQKYPSKWYISTQNCKDFPPKARFPRNEIPKFHILSMHVLSLPHMACGAITDPSPIPIAISHLTPFLLLKSIDNSKHLKGRLILWHMSPPIFWSISVKQNKLFSKTHTTCIFNWKLGAFFLLQSWVIPPFNWKVIRSAWMCSRDCFSPLNWNSGYRRWDFALA